MRKTRLPPLTFPRLWLAMAVGLTLVAAVLSLTPYQVPWPGPLEGDKDLHGLAYMFITAVWLQVTRAVRWPLTLIVMLVLGFGLEVAQMLTPTRIFHDTDLIANAIGVAVGGLLCLTPVGRSLGALDHHLARAAGYQPDNADR